MSAKEHKSLASKLVKLSLLGGAAWLWSILPRTRAQRLREQPGQGLIPAKTGLPVILFAHRGLHDAGSGLSRAAMSDEHSEASEYVAWVRDLAAQAGYEPVVDSAPVAPENSMAAFAAACEAGYGIELDIQLSKDGQVVVCHDPDLLRVAGLDVAIKDLTYEELTTIPLFPAPNLAGDGKAVSAKPAMGDLKRGNLGAMAYQHVPLLRDVLDLVDGRVPLIVEFKSHSEQLDEDLLRKGCDLLQAYQGQYCIESFDSRMVRWFKLNHPEVIRGQLAAPFSKQRRTGVVEGLKQGKLPKRSDVLAFLAASLLLNWYARPDFLALEWHMGKSLPARVARRAGATLTAWTVRTELDRIECADVFDEVIFEAFRPRV